MLATIPNTIVVAAGVHALRCRPLLPRGTQQRWRRHLQLVRQPQDKA